MAPAAIILLLCSAVIHAGWNLISKRQNPSGAFFLAGHAMTLAVAIPCFIYYGHRLHHIPGPVWGWIAVSGFFNGIYYFALAWAYRKGDLSLAYPLAKSLPTLFVTLLAFALGQGRQIGPLALAGIPLILVGCMILPIEQFHRWRPRDYLSLCCLLAAVAAAGTAGYTLADNEGVAILRSLPCVPMSTVEASIIYQMLLALASTFWLAVGVVCSKTERIQLRMIFQTGKLNAFLAGAGVYLAYTLVLMSMAYVRNVSYVSAFRQTCILIGAVLGIVCLKEKAYPAKLAGIAMAFVGLLLVALG